MEDTAGTNTIDVVHLDDVSVVKLDGEWDIADVPRLRAAFEGLDESKNVIVDLRGVSYLDSSSLTEILTLHKRITTTGKRLDVIISDGPVRRLFQITSLDRLLALPAELVSHIDRRIHAASQAIASNGAALRIV
jgi:anti-anti-sigma factor